MINRMPRNRMLGPVRGFFSLALLLGSSFLPAQNIQSLQQTGPIHISRGVQWTQAAGNGIAFTWLPAPGTQWACLMVQNNSPAITHSNVAASGWVTTDPKTQIIAQPNGAAPGGLQNSAYIYQVWAAPQVQYLAFVAGQVYARTGNFPIGGAAQAVFWLNNASGASGLQGDTFDFTEVDSPTPCVNQNSGFILTSSSMTGGSQVNRPCLIAISTGGAATGTGTVVSFGASQNTSSAVYAMAPRFHICAVSISGPNTTNAAQIGFVPGTSASSCPTTVGGGVSGYGWQTVAGGALSIQAIAAGGEIFSLPATNALCFVNAGTGTTVTYSISFDIW